MAPFDKHGITIPEENTEDMKMAVSGVTTDELQNYNALTFLAMKMIIVLANRIRRFFSRRKIQKIISV